MERNEIKRQRGFYYEGKERKIGYLISGLNEKIIEERSPRKSFT